MRPFNKTHRRGLNLSIGPRIITVKATDRRLAWDKREEVFDSDCNEPDDRNVFFLIFFIRFSVRITGFGNVCTPFKLYISVVLLLYYAGNVTKNAIGVLLEYNKCRASHSRRAPRLRISENRIRHDGKCVQVSICLKLCW